MKHDLLAFAVFLGALFLAATHAMAQQARACAPRAALVDRLATQYGETRQSMGLGANNQVIEIFASPVTGTWTIVVSSPAGLTCIIATGQAFENMAERLPPAGKPA